jgi:hypothetical protein
VRPRSLAKQASSHLKTSSTNTCTTKMGQLELQAPSRRLRNGDSCSPACLTAHSRWSSPHWDFGADSSILQSIKRLPTHHACMSTVQRHSAVTPDPVASAKPPISSNQSLPLAGPVACSKEGACYFWSHRSPSYATTLCIRTQSR